MKTVITFFNIIILGLAMSSASFADETNANAGSAYIVSYFEVSPQSSQLAVKLLKQLSLQSAKEKGNQRFEVLQQMDRPDHFAVLEAWSSQDALTAHQSSMTTTYFKENLKPLLRSTYDERPHTALEVGPVSLNQKKKNDFYAITHVDIVPTLKEQGVTLVKNITKVSRGDFGQSRYEALTQNSRPNHMTIVEIWSSKASNDAHQISEHKKEFRASLSTMSGSLYDERFYKLLQ
jgi:quinol monooxygenase YgiN